MADHNRLDQNQRTPATADIFAISKNETLKPNTSLPLLTPPSLGCKRKCETYKILLQFGSLKHYFEVSFVLCYFLNLQS
jgi:hypothetical protein